MASITLCLIITHVDKDYSVYHNTFIVIFKRYMFRSKTITIRRSSTKSTQERQRTYNVTVGRLCAATVAVERKYSECVCSLRWPARNAHAPYCHVGLPGSTIIFHTITQTARFLQKELLNK
jgi:hypothetical protein